VPRSTPTTYVKLGSDHAFSPALQNEMIARLHNPRVEHIDAGHLPMLGHPDQLAAVCNAAVEQTPEGG
jgi:pimeloyl-ACP methyl ester carboxylesterase